MSWGGVLSYNGGQLGSSWTVGTRRLYLARNPHPHPAPWRQRKGGCSYPGPGRQGRAVGASFSAVPGPPARGAAVASAELGPPAVWVGGGKEGAVTAVRQTPRPAPSWKGPSSQEVFQYRLCPPFYPPPHYWDQALSVL